MSPAARALVIVTLLLFQSHWLDDAFTGEPDTAGIVVSAIGSVPLLIGLLFARTTPARIATVVGLVFVAFISVADLIGLKEDGSRAPDLVRYWRIEFGLPLTITVLATLIAAIGAIIVQYVVSGFSRTRY